MKHNFLTRITYEERKMIEHGLANGLSTYQIGKALQRATSTINTEIKRYGLCPYNAEEAQRLIDERKKRFLQNGKSRIQINFTIKKAEKDLLENLAQQENLTISRFIIKSINFYLKNKDNFEDVQATFEFMEEQHKDQEEISLQSLSEKIELVQEQVIILTEQFRSLNHAAS